MDNEAKGVEKALRDTQNPKEIQEILEEQIDMAMEGHKRSNLGLYLSALAAGLEVSFSVFLMGILYEMFVTDISANQMMLLQAISYPLGFIFVILGRSELFTEHTTLAILPVLNGSTTVKSLLALWVIIYLGNLTGGYIFSWILSYIGPSMDIISEATLVHLAEKMLKYSPEIMFSSAVLAGWLMGLLSWLVTSSRDTISRITLVALVTTVIGIGGLHHSIVGSTEVFTGLLVSKDITLKMYLNFQFFSTLGNAVGGVVFVALIKFSHIKASGSINASKEPD